MRIRTCLVPAVLTGVTLAGIAQAHSKELLFRCEYTAIARQVPFTFQEGPYTAVFELSLETAQRGRSGYFEGWANLVQTNIEILSEWFTDKIGTNTDLFDRLMVLAEDESDYYDILLDNAMYAIVAPRSPAESVQFGDITISRLGAAGAMEFESRIYLGASLSSPQPVDGLCRLQQRVF
ncbi:MAG: hypothetical protein ACWA6X_02835 [Bauldia sp.]